MSYDPAKATWRETAVAGIISQRKKGQCKTELFHHAKACVNEMDGDLTKAAIRFIDCADEQEDWMQSAGAGQMQVEHLPDVWVQGKSDMKNGMMQGLDPREYQSYHAFRKAKGKQSEAKRNPKAQSTVSDESTSIHDRMMGVGKAKTVPRVVDGAKVTWREREADPLQSVEEALDEGTVVHANGTRLIPEDLVHLVECLDPLTEFSRARAIKQLNSHAESFGKDHRDGLSEFRRRMSK